MAVFKPNKSIFGMVHTLASPATPAHAGRSVAEIADHAAAEARTLIDLGCDGVIIENMHDTPYLLREVGPEVIATMTACGIAVRSSIGEGVPIGVQVLAGANHAALAVALAAGLDFVRVEGFTFAHVADEGLMCIADAGPLLRYRRAIDAEHIGVVADIKKKHSSHAITADIDIAETAKAAAFMGADGVIVTGTSTGLAASMDDIVAAQLAGIPVLVVSGVTPDTIAQALEHADGVIVGSSLKHHGYWANPIEPDRVRALIAAAGK